MSLTRPAGEIEARRDESGYWNVTVTKHGERSYVTSNLPANGDSFGGSDPWQNATLRDVTFEENPNAQRGILRLEYKETASGGVGVGNPEDNQADDDPIYSIRESGLELPVEQNSNYYVHWNYDLWRAKEKEDSTSWLGSDWTDYDTVTNKEDPWAFYKWVRRGDQAESPDGHGNHWKIWKEAAYPHTDSFIVSGPQVVERRFFSNKSDADTFVSNNRRGTKTTPGETFGISGGEWIIFDMDMQPNGSRWEGRLVYQWADTWNTDMYS